jgi:hypothetical protein
MATSGAKRQVHFAKVTEDEVGPNGIKWTEPEGNMQDGDIGI